MDGGGGEGCTKGMFCPLPVNRRPEIMLLETCVTTGGRRGRSRSIISCPNVGGLRGSITAPIARDHSD